MEGEERLQKVELFSFLHESILPFFVSPSGSLTLNSGQKASVTHQHLFRSLSAFQACRGNGGLSRGRPFVWPHCGFCHCLPP